MTHKWFRLFLALATMALYLSLAVGSGCSAYNLCQLHREAGRYPGQDCLYLLHNLEGDLRLNRDTIGKDPNEIHPGMVLTVPANCVPSETPPSGTVYDRGPMTHATGIYVAPYYTVAWGDTLSAIGQRFGVPWQDIAAANGIKVTLIYAGQALLIPGTSTGGTPPPSQGPAKRVYFQKGAVSDTRSGVIYQGVPKSYILGATNSPEKEVSSWSSKRSTGILWNFAKMCALLDFTCGGLLDVVDYFGR